MNIDIKLKHHNKAYLLKAKLAIYHLKKNKEKIKWLSKMQKKSIVSKLRLSGKFLSLIKNIYIKPIKSLEVFPWDQEWRMLLITVSYQPCTRGSQYNKPRERKDMLVGKEKIYCIICRWHC